MINQSTLTNEITLRKKFHHVHDLLPSTIEYIDKVTSRCDDYNCRTIISFARKRWCLHVASPTEYSFRVSVCLTWQTFTAPNTDSSRCGGPMQRLKRRKFYIQIQHQFCILSQAGEDSNVS